MNVSVLLPSRNNAAGFMAVCKNLSELASDPSQFEIVVALDDDEPQIDFYLVATAKYRAHIPIKLIKSKTTGYGNLHKIIELCASAASGDVLLAYNDDVLCETKDWDLSYKELADRHPLWPIASHVQEDHFQWAFPAISRKIYERVGAFCPFGVENFDRVWCATAQSIKSWGLAASVLTHYRTDPEKGSEDRRQCIAGWMSEWDARQKLWDETGRKVAELLK
jgi:hypothetical protein